MPTSARGSNAPAGLTRGFTLLELLLVLAIIAVAAGAVTLNLRDTRASALDIEAARLEALLESARAQARAMGLPVRFEVRAERAAANGDFRFVGLPATLAMPEHWLDPRVRADLRGAPALRLGPEPLIGAQRVDLTLDGLRVTLASDGLRPFQRVAVPTP